MLTIVNLFLGLGLTAFASAASSTSSSSSSSTTSVASVFLPIVNSQSLVASLSATNGDTKTMVIKCPDGTNSDQCGFAPFTATAGPSTLALTTTVGNSMVVDFKCHIEGSTTADCTNIYTGQASLYKTELSGSEGSATTTWTASTTLSSGHVTYLPVTITAGLPTSTSKGGAAATTAGGLGQILALGLVANVARAVVF